MKKWLVEDIKNQRQKGVGSSGRFSFGRMLSEDGQRRRKLKRIPLGPATLTRAEAERLRDDYLATINQAQVGIGGAILFRDFVRIYGRDLLPALGQHDPETRSENVLKNYLNPEFGDLMLRELTLEGLQGYFMRLQATKLAPESVDKIRDVLSTVLRTAVDYGRLSINPVEKIRLKKRKPIKAKPFIRVDQLNALLDLIAEPYATMVYVAAFTGGATGQRDEGLGLAAMSGLTRSRSSSDTAGGIGIHRSRMQVRQRSRSTTM